MRIDIHSHLMSVAFAEYLQGRDALPATVRQADGYVVHCAPQFSIHYGPPILSVGAKLQDMDAAGIDMSVLSPAPPGPHVLGGALADDWAARINDELSVMTAAHPGRFAGWASLGFGHPSRTIAEVDRCLDELGLAGFQVWSNLGDRSLDDPGVLPVLEHIAARGAAIHLHPFVPPGQPAMSPAMMTGFAFPGDTSLAVLRLIGAGLFDRDPVIVAAHLGGVLPWLRDRLAIHGQASAPFPHQPQLARPMGEYLDQLYVDTVSYGLAPLEYCYTQLGADRMLFGTDHPYAAPGVPQDLVDRLPCTQDERGQILAGNAQRLLRLDATVAARALDVDPACCPAGMTIGSAAGFLL
jgi:predicted TIM-barrel fold metal-dependent hydrolase